MKPFFTIFEKSEHYYSVVIHSKGFGERMQKEISNWNLVWELERLGKFDDKWSFVDINSVQYSLNNVDLKW